jgi:hypothetical protein
MTAASTLKRLKEVTEAMIEAGVRCYREPPNGLLRSHGELCRQIYLAMSAARSTPTSGVTEAIQALFAAAHEADDCHQPLECDPRTVIALQTELRHLEAEIAAMSAARPAVDEEVERRAIAHAEKYDTPRDDDPRRRYTPAQMGIAIRHALATIGCHNADGKEAG